MAKSSISGFPEFLPSEQIKLNCIRDIIRRHYERIGAVPLETPAVERIETLTAKGGNEKEIYGLRRLHAEEGDDGKDLALRFDLTVPLARYVVQHAGSLNFPFRRYQMQPVWRGERPQAGRYRQFEQCDIDVIGDGSLSLINDAEMPVAIDRIFTEMAIGRFMISVNNRKILTGFLASIGLDTDASVSAAIKVVDNLEKVGPQVTNEQLRNLGVSDDAISRLLEFFSIELGTDEMLVFLRDNVANETMLLGVDELETVVGYMRMMKLPEDHFRVDPSIARGLDYYTGTVYETRLLAHPGLGSICSGGRYDKLLRTLGADRDLPGVGISIGLTRLFPRLVDAGVLTVGPATIAPVLVTAMEPNQLQRYLSYGATLRDAGINTEIYTEPKKLGVQMKYANRKGFSIVIIAGEQDFSTGTLIVRRLSDGEQAVVAESDLVTTVQKMLGARQ
jgi:histidyl-tRNA synthetase